MARIVEGIVRKHREGFGFLIQPKGTDDVYLPAEELVGVMDGDRISAEVFKRRGRLAGRLLEIVERGRRVIIGVFKQQGKESWVEPSDAGLHHAILARIACEPAPVDGQSVKVVLTEWPTGVSPAKGEIVAVLGDGADPMQEVLAMAFARGFSDAFSADVVSESSAIPDRVGIGDLAGRRDLRNLPLVTIDGADAKDFDDAIFVEKVPRGGYRLVVAIADVVHYVREGTALDREALARGTSVYFPNLVLPMLPERLSNGICSLVPNEDRLCMVAELIVTEEGKTVNTEIYEAVMRSHARLTYDEVAEMMLELGLAVEGSSGGKETPKQSGERKGPPKRKRNPTERDRWQAEHLSPAVELSKKLNKRRLKRGCIDFDLPEAQIKLDENNLPVAIEARERRWPHRLVEEFMLAANEAVAFFFHRHGLPTIYRVHDEPDELKLATFATLARAHGFAIRAGDDIPSRVINDFLSSLVGRPEQRTLNQLLLRAMQQAIYSSENIGHYGLAAPHYLHFTSPIRRYPDLMVHRLLKAHWKRGGRVPAPSGLEQTEARLDRISTQASERERAAVEAERESSDFFSALFMRDRVGESFDATVATVAAFGIFVELIEAHVQGLVKIETLGRGVSFDETRMRMVVGASGRSWSVGDTIRVVCVSVNVARRQITFEPEGVESGGGAFEPAPRIARPKGKEGGKKQPARQAEGKRGGRGGGGRPAKKVQTKGGRAAAPAGPRKAADDSKKKPAPRKRRSGRGGPKR